jgi:glutamate-ammonia-ligase adenylyltransferase
MGSLPDIPSLTEATEPLRATADHSRFVQRIRRRYAPELALLPPGLPRRDDVVALIERLRSDGRPLASALRVARHLVLERLAVLDIEQSAAMPDITLAMTELAEATLDLALAAARTELDARFGAAERGRPAHRTPRRRHGQARRARAQCLLRFGPRTSTGSGQTTGAQHVSAHEYFAQLARGLAALIGETIDDGFVFRRPRAVPTATRPPVVSLVMLEENLQAQGRELSACVAQEPRRRAARERVQRRSRCARW